MAQDDDVLRPASHLYLLGFSLPAASAQLPVSLSVMRQILLALVLAADLVSPGLAAAQSKDVELERALRAAGGEVIRGVTFDLCYPKDAEEYEKLGKNAVVMLTAWSALSTELPLRSAYLDVKGVRVPLQRITVFNPRQRADELDPKRMDTEQASFYLVPLSLLEQASSLKVDFRGERTDFGVVTYQKGRALAEAPSFIRLDEYKSPSDPDMDAVTTLLVREYPDYFK